jgi:predicted SAM-dependent methyltransferase
MKKVVITSLLVVAGIVAGLALTISLPSLKLRLAARRAPGEAARYLNQHPVRKVQIGAGGLDYPGWLNTDIEPTGDEVYLDATKPFPFPDGSIQYIFGEHVIEHVTYADGLRMLRECHRVLASGGKIRFATPNLLNYFKLFAEPKTPEIQRYIDAKLKFHGWPRTARPESYILNLELRSFGHQFVYDPRSLSDSLAQAGFQSIVQFPPGESDDPELRGIEARHKNPATREMNDFESMVLQAVKP